MDAEKLVGMLVEGELGDLIRAKHTADIIADLEDPIWDDEREWANGVIEWLRDNYS